jgi:hypothetical protein
MVTMGYQQLATDHVRLESGIVSKKVSGVRPQVSGKPLWDTRCDTYFLKKSLKACLITSPPTWEMDRVRGMSLGQTSTQFWA